MLTYFRYLFGTCGCSPAHVPHRNMASRPRWHYSRFHYHFSGTAHMSHFWTWCGRWFKMDEFCLLKLSIFTKPISLMSRLFVAITRDIVLLSLIALAFIFKSVWVGVGSTVMVLFISLIELLVAAIQAYVFVLFSSLYIGMAMADHEHH